MTFSRPVAPGAHPSHDTLLVAAFVAGDLGPADARDARALVSTCTDCATLADDLRAIAVSTRALRDQQLAAPAERRFTLDAPTASRLRAGRWWRRLLRPFGTAEALRPTAGAFAALGLAGFLLAAIPGIPLGGTFRALDGSEQAAGASDGALTPVGMSASPGPKDLASAVPGASPAASGEGRTSGGGPSGGGSNGEGAYSGGGGDVQQGTGAPGRELAGRLEARLPLVALSVGLLGAGLCLILLRRAARRLT